MDLRGGIGGAHTCLGRAAGWCLEMALLAALTVVGVGALGTVARADEEGGEPPPSFASDAELPGTADLEKFAEDLAKEESVDERLQRLVSDLLAFATSAGGGSLRDITKVETMALACRPAAGLALTEGTFRRLQDVHQADTTGTLGFLAKVRRVAILLERRRQKTAESELGAAYGHLSYQVACALAKEAADAAVLRKAVAALRKHAERPAVPSSAWDWALTSLLDPKAGQPDDVLDWAADEFARLAAANLKIQDLRWRSARLDLARGPGLLERSPKAGGVVLSRALAELDFLEELWQKDRDTTRLYNLAVTAARRGGLSVKSAYRTKTVSSANVLLASEVPTEMGWTDGKASGDQKEWVLRRVGGPSGVVVVTVWRYKTTTDYVDDEGRALGGDNMAQRMKEEMDYWKTMIVKVKKIAPTVARLSKALPVTRGFEVRGTVDDGSEMRVREWYWRSQAKSLNVYNLVLEQSAGDLDKDPEVDLFLSSFHEVGASAK